MDNPTASQEPLKTGGERARTGADTPTPPKMLVWGVLAIVLIGAATLLAYSGPAMQGGQQNKKSGLDEVSPAARAILAGPQEQWFIGAIESLHGAKVVPAQAEIIPWPSATFIIMDGLGREATRRSISASSGQFGMMTGSTAATVRITARGIEELRPYISKFVAGQQFTAEEKAEAGAKIAMLRLRREVAF